MVAQHVSVHKQGPMIYVRCTIGGHSIITFDENLRNDILSGKDVEMKLEEHPLQGTYIKEFI